MSELYIGLMSGTSADGIDAALVAFKRSKVNLIEQHYEPYPRFIRQKILALTHPGPEEINRIAELDIWLGKAFGAAVNKLLKKAALSAKDIMAIGSHGHTIRHLPHKNFTLQIGDPNAIAAETGITTVADFRRRDMAYGGQGAPLVPAFHQYLFAKQRPCGIINIGGSANITIIDLNSSYGFDTGPGNGLLDSWCELNLGKTYDKNGKWGSKGMINYDLLKKLLEDPFFKKAPPKSTGREYFNLEWLQKQLPKKISPSDVQATLTDLTASSIIKAVPFASGKLFICGGGVHNSFLMSRLKFYGKNYVINSTETLGVDPDGLEAQAFAWLAKQTLEKKPGNLKQVTGATAETILGGVYYV